MLEFIAIGIIVYFGLKSYPQYAQDRKEFLKKYNAIKYNKFYQTYV